jgi:hypothetical protein
VHWADLHCHEVQYVESDGRSFYRVIVEEASPESRVLQALIAEALEAAGYADVDVETAW